MDINTLATAASFIFTLLIFSYLLGDNVLYRLAIYIFVGLTAAYTTAVVIGSVLLPLLDETSEIILVIVALILTGLLLLRPVRRLLPITSLALAFLVAVGASVAIVGTITGTLLPLTLSTGNLVGNDLINGIITAIGVITTLFYFQYFGRARSDDTVARARFTAVFGRVGEGFIAVTLGALYASAILSTLTILTDRISFLLGGLS